MSNLTMTPLVLLERIEPSGDGTLFLVLCKTARKPDWNEGDFEFPPNWHRAAFVPGEDIDAKVALINAHLECMGFPGVPDDAIERLRAYAAIEWTAERIARTAKLQEVDRGDTP